MRRHSPLLLAIDAFPLSPFFPSVSALFCATRIRKPFVINYFRTLLCNGVFANPLQSIISALSCATAHSQTLCNQSLAHSLRKHRGVGWGGCQAHREEFLLESRLSALGGESLSRPESRSATPYSQLSRRENARRHPAKAEPDSFPLDSAQDTCLGLRLSIETGRIQAAGRFSVAASQSFSSYCFRSRGVVLRALIILMPSLRSACATIKTRPALDVPTVRKRCSDAEWSGSGYVIAKGSPNTLAASWNETRCFLRFRRALAGSHSKFTLPSYPAELQRGNWRRFSRFGHEGCGERRSARDIDDGVASRLCGGYSGSNGLQRTAHEAPSAVVENDYGKPTTLQVLLEA
jgi:hypothetical protein